MPQPKFFFFFSALFVVATFESYFLFCSGHHFAKRYQPNNLFLFYLCCLFTLFLGPLFTPPAPWLQRLRCDDWTWRLCWPMVRKNGPVQQDKRWRKRSREPKGFFLPNQRNNTSTAITLQASAPPQSRMETFWLCYCYCERKQCL